MRRDITRRDFLNGVGVTITGSLFSASPMPYVDCAIDQAHRAVEEIGRHASGKTTSG